MCRDGRVDNALALRASGPSGPRGFESHSRRQDTLTSRDLNDDQACYIKEKTQEALCLLFEISPAYQYYANQADDTDEAIEVPFVRYVSVQVVHAEVLYSENDYGYDNQYS